MTFTKSQEVEHELKEYRRKVRLKVQLPQDRTYLFSNKVLEIGSVVSTNATYTSKSIKGALTDRSYWTNPNTLVYELETKVVAVRRAIDLKDVTNEYVEQAAPDTKSDISGTDQVKEEWNE